MKRTVLQFLLSNIRFVDALLPPFGINDIAAVVSTSVLVFWYESSPRFDSSGSFLELSFASLLVSKSRPRESGKKRVALRVTLTGLSCDRRSLA